MPASKYCLTTEDAVSMFSMLKDHFSSERMTDVRLAKELGIAHEVISNIKSGRLMAGAAIQLGVLISTGWTYPEFRERVREHRALSVATKNTSAVSASDI